MKKIIHLFAFIFMVTFFNTMAHSKPITIEQVDALNFGQIIADPNGGTVTVRPNGGIITGGSNIALGGHSNARFKLRGDKNASIILSFSSGDQLTDDGASITLDSFTTIPTSPAVMATNGKLNVDVGARININASQKSGTYQGTYIFTVEYQ